MPEPTSPDAPDIDNDVTGLTEFPAGWIVARRLNDGRTEFAYQPEGGERVLPASRFFPADAPVDRWLNSSPVTVGDVAVGRINARLLDDGRIEFAFTATDGERIYPSRRHFPISSSGAWLRSSLIDSSLETSEVQREIVENDEPAPGSACRLSISQATEIVPGLIRNGLLSADDCGDPEHPTEFADAYHFTLPEQSDVTVTLTSSTFNSYLRLHDSNGRQLHTDNDSGGGRNARIQQRLDPGMYYIVATEWNPHGSASTGRYEIQVIVTTPPDLADPAVQRQIAENYRPILWFTEGEKYYPVAVEAMTRYARLVCSAIAGYESVTPELLGALAASATEELVSLQRALTASGAELGFFDRQHLKARANHQNCNDENSYLDIQEFALPFPYGAWDHKLWWEWVTENDPDVTKEVVYYRVAEVNGWVAVQYWFFYIFNDAPFSNFITGNYDHEGDWEGVLLWFSPDVLLGDVFFGRAEPTEIGFASHEIGTWPIDRVVYEDEFHPDVFIAEGTHASFHAPGDWEIYIGPQEVLDVTVDRDGWTCNPDDHARREVPIRDYALESLTDKAWLNWQGRWGEPKNKSAGPHGPMFKDHWNTRPSRIHGWLETFPLCDDWD